MDQPTLLSDVFDLIEASIQHGRAIERADKDAAAKAYRVQLAALGRILAWIGEDDTPAAELLTQREPGA